MKICRSDKVWKYAWPVQLQKPLLLDQFKYQNPKLMFLAARCYASTGLCDRNVSICLSICHSHTGIVLKQRKLASRFLNYLVAAQF